MKRYVDSKISSIALAVVFATLFLIARPAMAQEEMRSQVNLQFTGLIPKDSSGTDFNGNGITDHGSRSGGLLAGYKFSLNRWAAVEGNYGFSRDTQSYSGSFATYGIQADVHEMTGAFVLRLPVSVSRMRPYALAGTGVLRFDPTSNLDSITLGAQAQTKGVFLYGGGVDVDMTRNFGVRAEYRGLLTKTPDFSESALTIGTMTHIAQPSVGIYFRF